MERNKNIGGSRSSKSKIGAPHHGSELYALGTKASSSRDEKSKVISSVKASVSDRKREATPLGSVSKKAKLGSSSSSIGNVQRLSSGDGGNSSSSTTTISSTVLEPWEQVATEVNDALDLLYAVKVAFDQHDSDGVTGLLCGAIKSLTTTASTSRSKSDNTAMSVALIYLCKELQTFFCNDYVTSALLSILKRDNQHSFKGRSNQQAQVVAANLLVGTYYDQRNWPEIFVRVYIDDASGDRVWVDNPCCAPFVENVCTAFNTRIPPKSLLQPDLMSSSSTSSTSQIGSSGAGSSAGPSTSSANPSSSIISIDDDSNDNSMHSNTETSRSETLFECPVQERYANSMNIIEKYVLDTVRDQFNRRQQQDCSTRNFLKFLSTTCGIADVRALSVTRLELWIHNQKLMKSAQELLTHICYNVTGQTHKDNEVLANLVKMRLKSKPLINIFMTCLKEMINLQPNILYTAIKYVVQNELSNARNPNNMGMLANMFQTKPEQSAKHLAEIYQEFLLQREDCLRTLRVFLRELVKMLRYEINLVEFCKAFLTNRPEIQQQIQQFEFKDRYFQQMVDLTCLCMFLTISPQVREANVSMRAGRDMKNNSVLISFYNQMSQIHLDALTWMHETVPILFRPQASEYGPALHKILLLDAPEQYSKCDQWPPEPERGLLLRLISETPVHQDSILRIILIGITKEIPFNIPDTIDVIEQTVRRASSLKTDYPAVEANKLEIIDFLFSMAEYHHPENIVLPVGYEPPKLAISVLYWKVWKILLILSAHNPSTFGSFCWEQYPMLRQLMEMCITNQFHDIKTADEELQVAAVEKTQILEFEAHLAAATSKVIITEQNSLLLSQLMLMDPMGVARRPPNHILELLQQLNASHKLGHLLCRSRKPDLLLDIIQRHGTTQSMPWLADLVQNSDGDFNHLPVQCLCEFLLSNSANINIENTRDAELLDYLRKLLQDPNGDRNTACEVLEYFLRRLSSTAKQSRILAIKGLKLLLEFPAQQQQSQQTNDKDDLSSSDWLLLHVLQIPHFMHARPLIVVQLRAACQIENNPDLVMTYIQFIAANTLHDPVPDMLEHVMDMAQLIVERSTIFQQIIPKSTTNQHQILNRCDTRLQTLNCLFVMFNNYMIKLREHKSPYEWTDYPDLLMVHFDDGVQLPIHLNIIHAFVILLTHSSITLPSSIPILDYWFPPGRQIPQAYTVDTNEPVQILPDWLKLKMIRSEVDRLVEAAMYDLTPDQIVLFVQNFGTPISSMSKLLALLDHAVMEQFDTVKNAILNKAYLAQLIEIQQARGAKNGHITMQALELNLHSQLASSSSASVSSQSIIVNPTDCTILSIPTSSPSPNVVQTIQPTSTINVLDAVNLDQFQTILSTNEKLSSSSSSSYITSKEIEEIVEILLKSPSLNKVNSIRFRRLIQQLIGYERSASSSSAIKRQQQQKIQDSSGKLLSIQSYTVNKVCIHLMRLAETPHAQYFFQNIFQKVHMCTLFRTLLIYTPEKIDNYNLIMQCIDIIIQNMSIHPTPENTAILQILLNKRKSFVRKVLDKRHTSKTDTESFLKVLLSAKLTELETQGRKFVNDMVYHRKTENLVDAIINVFNAPQIKTENPVILPTLSSSSSIASMTRNNVVFYEKQGILIDWLAEIDSEMITINERQQIDLLFSIIKRNYYYNEFRYYMLSLLCHQSNWSTLQMALNSILEKFRLNYDPTAVLNFIEALIQNPKLWQGRDKAVPKHEQIEYVVTLNSDQINVFIEYVIHEICLLYESLQQQSSSSTVSLVAAIIKSSTSGLSQSVTINEKLNSRLMLLFRIINLNAYDLRQLISFIRLYRRCNEQLKLQLLQHLYLIEPTIKFLDEDLVEVYKMNTSGIKTCRCDKITNYLISTIALTGANNNSGGNNSSSQPSSSQFMQLKDYQLIANDAEILIRKLASSHPSLVLRQLNVLASLLQGKTHMSLNALRFDFHLLRLLQLLRVLEILQPLIFDDNYKSGLHTALDCYFTIIKYHIRAKEVYSIMLRFIEFLQAYISVNPSTALLFIEKYTDIIQELSAKYRNNQVLYQLVQSLSLMKHKTCTTESKDDETVKQEFDLEDQQQHHHRSSISNIGHSQPMDIDEPTPSSSSAAIAAAALSLSNVSSIGSSSTPSTSGMSHMDIENRGLASFALCTTAYSNLSRQFFNQAAPHYSTLVNILQHSNSEETILQTLIEIDNITHKRSGYIGDVFDRLLELILSPNSMIRLKSYTLLIRHLKYNPGNSDLNKSTLNAYLQCLWDSNSNISTTALNNLVDICVLLQEYTHEILSTVFELGIQSRLNSCLQIKKCIQRLKLQHGC